MKYLRLAINHVVIAPTRTGLRIIGLIVGTLYSLASIAQVDFTEVAAPAGINGDTFVARTTHSLGMNWIDYDNDGWPDLFAINGYNGDGAHLYRNEGNGTFSRQDILLPALANDEMMGSVYADYDNDGDSDIYIFTDNFNGPVGPSAGPVNALLQNQWVENGNQIVPGQPLFIDVSAAAGVEDLLDAPLADGPAYRSSTGGFFDYDRDGNIDLYVCHWDRGKHGQSTNRDRLYHNLGNGTFEDVTATSGLIPVDDGTYERPCLAFIGAHLDFDLWPDIYIGNVDAPLAWERDYIYQNNAGTGFTDRTLDSPGVGDDAKAAMGVTIGDIDLNGAWDIYQSDLNGGLAPLGNPLYMHTGTDILYNDNSADVANIAANEGSWGVNFLDINHDGYEDLFVSTMGVNSPSIVYINDQDGTFSKLQGGVAATTARGSAYADFDRDGDLDIAVVGIDAPLQLFRNDTVSSGHWLQIQLVSNDSQTGLWSNRDAIGTLVKVSANGKVYMRQVIGGDSGHGQNSLDLHFGLDTAGIIDQIEVFWPSGATLVLTNQPVDTFMAISELGASVALVSPLPNTDITSPSTTFNWTSDGVEPIQSWRLMAGTVPGASDFFDSGDLANTQMSAQVTGLPTDGTQVFVHLQYQLNGVNHHIDYQYSSSNQGPGTPAITSPLPGTTLTSGDVNYFWASNGANVDDWQLQAGITAGDNSLFDSGVLPSTSTTVTVSGLPEDGSTIHVTLRWTDAGIPGEANYTYTASSGPGAGVPLILSPLDGATLAGASETFTWSAEGTVVDKWRLEVGSVPDGRDLFVVSPDAATTSTVVTGLPTDGSSVYVNLKWRIGGVVSVASYVYTAASDAPPPPGTPEITSPLPGTTLPSGDVSFFWADNGTVVDDWQLLAGTSVGGSSLFDSGVLANTTTTAVVSGLPEDGSTIHVTLRWNEGGVPGEVNYTYTASSGPAGGVPLMLSPLDGATLAGSTETFTWSADGAVVDNWRLEVGTTPGARDLFGKNWASTVTSTEVTGLPTDGSLVYVSLKWRTGGVVTTLSFVYTAASDTPPPPGAPAITSPIPGTILPSGDVNFFWADNGTIVDDWQLQAGTSVGDNSLYDSGILPITTTSVVVIGLPEDSSTIHVTLRWNEGGNANALNYTYTASSGTGGGGVPMMLAPLEGATLAGSSETFTWSAEGAAVVNWRLEVGTTPGGRDLFGKSWDSTVTSILVSGLPTDGSVVYVKLKWKIGAVISETNLVYTAALP